jgi:hypothetical protein
MAKSRKPIEVWGLGSGGVNLVKSPIHLDDNELIQAQNAEPYRDRGQSGVRKRPAWRPINTGATAAISGIISVELAASGAGDSLISDGTTTDIPASGTKGLVLVARNTRPATAAWKYTTDGGTTWSTTTALSHNIANNDHSAIVYHGRAFYAGESDNIGQILCFDGQREFEFCRLPFGPSAATTGGTDMNAVGFAMGQFYISLNNGTTGRVFQVDPVTGAAVTDGWLVHNRERDRRRRGRVCRSRVDLHEQRQLEDRAHLQHSTRYRHRRGRLSARRRISAAASSATTTPWPQRTDICMRRRVRRRDSPRRLRSAHPMARGRRN